MTHFSSLLRVLPACFLLFAFPAFAAPTLVELTAEATRSAANDLARATVFAEATAILGYGADLPRYVAWLASH